ncbi:MAG: hypothetical protein K8E66_12875, partial [Phycisphaerales bacterium]|nr:hypothetical protein [Phycisphaerales bacterium]
LSGHVVSGLGAWLSPRRERIARAMLLGRAWAWPVVLVFASGVYIGMIEAKRRATSGDWVGQQLGAKIAAWADQQGATEITLVADGLIEARPEVLLATEASAIENGCEGFSIRWTPGLEGDFGVHRPGGIVLLALRNDAEGDESARLHERLGGRLEPIFVDNSADWLVHKFSFRLYLVTD